MHKIPVKLVTGGMPFAFFKIKKSLSLILNRDIPPIVIIRKTKNIFSEIKFLGIKERTWKPKSENNFFESLLKKFTCICIMKTTDSKEKIFIRNLILNVSSEAWRETYIYYFGWFYKHRESCLKSLFINLQWSHIMMTS